MRWSRISDDGWLTVVGKGAERRVPLHPVLVAALGRAREPASGAPDRVFPGHRREALHPTTVWTWARELGLAAGVGPVQSHVLRHTALTTALDATGDLRAVQELAGHARPETTAGYTRLRDRRLVAAAMAVSYS